MPAFVALSEAKGASVYQLTRDSCAPLIGFRIEHRDPTQAGKCAAFQDVVLAEVRRLKEEAGLRGVVLSPSWHQHMRPDLIAYLVATLDALEGMGLRVLVIGPSPSLPFRAPECLLRRDAASCGLSREALERQRAAVWNPLRQAVAGRARVHLVDPTTLLCDSGGCPAIRDGVVLYIDAGHLSATAARGAAPGLADDFRWVAKGPEG